MLKLKADVALPNKPALKAHLGQFACNAAPSHQGVAKRLNAPGAEEAATPPPNPGVDAGCAKGLPKEGVDCAGLLAPKLNEDDPNSPPLAAGVEPKLKPCDAWTQL